MADKNWESYEEVAAHLLDQFSSEFGIGKVEGKQIVPGASGTEWEIDGKGYSEDGVSFVIVECKRYTTSRVSQEIVGGLAYRIQDTGASGGIIVTPLGFQEGAKIVADHEGIQTVTLNKDSTRTDYVLSFLNKICVGLSDTINVSINETLTIKVIDKNGNVVDSRTIK